MRLLNSRLRFALRAVLVAVWASAALISPAHAAVDSFQDPCQQASVSADHDGPASDLDKDFHAAHGCGTCHAHAFTAAAAQGLKPTQQATLRVFAHARTSPFRNAEGPFRPPRA